MKTLKKNLNLIFLVVFYLITSLTKAQSIPLDSNEFDVGDLTLPNAVFKDVQTKARAYFESHPEIDSTNPMLKRTFNRWEHFWETRAVFINGDSIYTNIGDVANAIASYDYVISPTNNIKKWTLISPDKDDYQNLGVVTCIWSDPDNADYILIGTSSAGLWKTTDGGLNWQNITDSYIGQSTPQSFFYHYPFGVTSIAVSPVNSNIILIAATIPFGFYMDSKLNGFGILKSLDGGQTWSKSIQLFNASSPTGSGGAYNLGLNEGIRKIKFDPVNPNWVYALTRSKLYFSNDLFVGVSTLFNNNSSSVLANLSTNDNYTKLNLRDIEILDVLNTDNTSDRLIFISTDSYSNISAQLIQGNYLTPSCHWTNITGLLSSPNFKDVIAIENDKEANNTTNLYVAYKIYAINPYNKFIVDCLTRSTNTMSYRNNKFIYYDYNDMDSPCNGFGYYNDVFESYNTGMRFVVGGYGITFVYDNTSNVTNTSVFPFYEINNYKTPNTITPNNEGYGKNKTMHFNVKNTFTRLYNDNNQYLDDFVTFVGTEGGITKIKHGSIYTNYVNEIKNINGKGLAIQEFNDITSTKNNDKDIIIGGTMHNGYWGRNGQNANWENYWLDDGGKVLINDNLTNFLYGVTFDTWGDGIAGNYLNLSRKYFRSSQGLSLNSSSIPYIKPYLDNNITQFTTTDPIALVPPITFDQANPGIIYAGGHNIYQSNDNGTTWNSITSFPSNDYAKDLKVIAQSNSNPNIMYVSFSNATWCYSLSGVSQYPNNCHSTEHNKLYRRNNDLTWTDISQYVGNADALSWTQINDILINPNNIKASEVWTVHSGAWNASVTVNQGINRVLHSTDGGNTWTPFSEGLSCLSVNCIRIINYENNPNNYTLLVGTDAGVYYRNSGDNHWTAFRDGMPLVIVTDIEINNKEKKIRAATFGRGIWEAEFPCVNTTPQYTTINTTPVIWNTNQVSSGIHILPGKTLTITSNVRFSSGATVIIDEGAKLIVNGGTLEACPDVMWGGVKILGSMEIDPETFIESLHAIVQIFNNGTIKDAVIGIENTGGGIVYMDNANFVNNQKAIVMYGSTYQAEKSYFQNGNFKTNSLYHIPTTYPFKHFVELNNIYKLNILGCIFENKIGVGVTNNYNAQGKGIVSFGSVFTVADKCNNPNITTPGTPCPPEYSAKSEFRNLEYGIYATSDNLIKNFTVRNTTFDNNSKGIFAMTINDAVFTSNKFNIPYLYYQYDPYYPTSPAGAYGMYLNSCSGYTVEGNTFDKVSSVTNASWGLIINNSGNANNSVYNNIFKNIEYAGTQSQENNRGTLTEEGLKIKCNDYSYNKQDIFVASLPPSSNLGISIWQGAGITNPNDILNVRKPAGNTFSKADNTSLLLTDYNNTYGDNIKYFHHSGTNADPWVPLSCNQPPKITLSPVNVNYTKQAACPSIAYTGNVEPREQSDLIQGLSDKSLQLNSARLILQIWVDGGNTEGLKQTVKLSYPWEAYELYNELLGLSPYLSDDVLKNAIQNEDGLPPLMLKLILLANPQAVRSNEVMDALRARNNPFPEEWMVELEQGLEVLSPLEYLEADVAYYATERKTYLDLLKKNYLADTIEGGIVNLIQLLDNETDIESRYELVFAELANHDPEAANNTLNDIGQMLPENEAEIDKYNKLTMLLPVIVRLENESITWDDLEGGERTIIYDLSDNNNELPGMLAKSIRLHFDSTYIYKELVYLLRDQTLKMATDHKINKTAISSDQVFKVSPNPADKFMIVEYPIDISAKEALLLITDMQGRLQMKHTLKTTTNQTLIDVSSLKNGTYHCTIMVDGQQKTVNKIIVQH